MISLDAIPPQHTLKCQLQSISDEMEFLAAFDQNKHNLLHDIASISETYIGWLVGEAAEKGWTIAVQTMLQEFPTHWVMGATSAKTNTMIDLFLSYEKEEDDYNHVLEFLAESEHHEAFERFLRYTIEHDIHIDAQEIAHLAVGGHRTANINIMTRCFSEQELPLILNAACRHNKKDLIDVLFTLERANIVMANNPVMALNHYLHAYGPFNKDGYYYMQYKMIDAQHKQELIGQIGGAGVDACMRKI